MMAIYKKELIKMIMDMQKKMEEMKMKKDDM
jgi:hypothetical protein